MTNVCPKCQKDDKISRLPAIVKAGQATGTYSGPSGGVTYSDGKWGNVGGWTTLSGSSATDLARALQPPVEPRKKGGSCIEYLLVAGVAFGAVATCTMTLSIGLVVLAGDLSSPIVGLLGQACFSLGIIIVPLLSVWLLWKHNAPNRARAEEEYAKAKPRWERGHQRWDRSYYCDRDGIVFDPETGEYCEVKDLGSFVYGLQ